MNVVGPAWPGSTSPVSRGQAWRHCRWNLKTWAMCWACPVSVSNVHVFRKQIVSVMFQTGVVCIHAECDVCLSRPQEVLGTASVPSVLSGAQDKTEKSPSLYRFFLPGELRQKQTK